MGSKSNMSHEGNTQVSACRMLDVLNLIFASTKYNLFFDRYIEMVNHYMI